MRRGKRFNERSGIKKERRASVRVGRGKETRREQRENVEILGRQRNERLTQ